MHDEKLLQRTGQSLHVMTGKPVFRGTRLSVEYMVKLLAHGASEQEILDEYGTLTPKDIQACLPSAGTAMYCSEQ